MTLSSSTEFVGQQFVEAKAELAGGRYIQIKPLKTFYKLPKNPSSVYHTVSKTEAIAEYLIISGSGLALKYASNSPAGLTIKASYYGLVTNYSLTGLGVKKGIPPRSAGQYYQIKYYYTKKGLNIETKIWYSKKAFKN